MPKKRKLSYDNPKTKCDCGALVPHTCQNIRKDLIGENSKFTRHAPFDPNKKEKK